ncbi:CAAX protease [Thermocoleostomius sinensis]|uniref:CAAX protease n=1 Tax=Thermocoleostomius sinensis A174 TaxID=2016057 RepID=A0A9E8ZE29_9CYAN|nr:CAAX protease [Thermocoleostomius sinensis]WAL61267.1 CAAX protease [Thermocoleostomius sinensis A174]
MSFVTLDRIWEVLGWVFGLNGEVFREVAAAPRGGLLALLVVLLAGLSLAIGQSIILFINRVKPIRFVFSLFISAILYLFEVLFLVFSTWLIGLLPRSVQLPLPTLFIVLGLSYAPLLFSFLGALPYLGFPLLRILSIWHLLAMVVGFSAVTNLGMSSAFGYVAFGWFVKELLGNTIGQPLSQLGRRLAERVAGGHLALHRKELTEILQSGFDTRFFTGTTVAAPSVQLDIATPDRQASISTSQSAESLFANASVGAATLPMDALNPDEPIAAPPRTPAIPQSIRLGIMLLGMVLLFLVIALLLRPVRLSLFSWYDSLPWVLRRVLDLSWIGFVALVFAGLLAPLETLGWWAGWYNDDLDTTRSRPTTSAQLSRQNHDSDSPSRYVVYVDGVGQSSDAYTPDVAEFVEALQEVLPDDVEFIQGLMMYSVFNKPLNQDRPLAWLWRLADKMRWENPTALLGFMVNVRNAWIVAISADKRYGPIYNQGIAQVLYNGLLNRGYQPGGGIPITLIGYSGGAQMSIAAAPYLKRVLGSEIDVISLGGVMSANINVLKLGHLYHLVGTKDGVAKLGPLLFPGRRQWFPLSYWNRAMRKGKISEIALGPVGHQVPGGIMDPHALLPTGESHLQHTIALILSILDGRLLDTVPQPHRKLSNYELYKQADFNNHTYYPLMQTVNAHWYRPIAPWMGRLILPQPSERRLVRGVWLEVHHADRGYENLVGQRVMLRWADEPRVKNLVRAVTQDVHFSVDATYSSQYDGTIHPERLNHWQQVGPLESLAGSHPTDDLIVMLTGTVDVQAASSTDRSSLPTLYIRHQPIEITGRYYGLVRFEAPIANTDRFQVSHFNTISRQFDGGQEVVRLPPVVQAKNYGSFPSTTHQLEQSPLNETGWYIYGAQDANGEFVVQSLAPRSLFRLQPDRVVFGSQASYRYIRRESWADVVAQKGRISSVLCVGGRKPSQERSDSIQAAIDEWQVGDRALLLHVYGGIGGNNKEPAAATPIFFGHFSYGLATVIHDPISDERRFDICYYQVYSHNTDGLTAGTLHWSRYMGDRQFGWVGTRPVCDILIKFDPFTGEFDINGDRRSALTTMVKQLEAMTARYRIGDGTGATYVGPANNCAQDSNQALFASLRTLSQMIDANQPLLQTWLTHQPDQVQRYQQLLQIKTKLYQRLQPFGSPRTDWESNEFNLGRSLEDEPLRNLITGLGSWRTLLPRKSSDMVVQVFLEQGASVWVLRTNQVGGYDPDIEPISPMTI